MASDLSTDKTIVNAKPHEKPYTLKDGDGFFVLIHPKDSKYFQLRCTLHGKDKLVRLGIYRVEISLAVVRAKTLMGKYRAWTRTLLDYAKMIDQL